MRLSRCLQTYSLLNKLASTAITTNYTRSFYPTSILNQSSNSASTPKNFDQDEEQDVEKRSSSFISQQSPKVKLHPGNQFSLEEIQQGLHKTSSQPTSKDKKREIEELYEFEKLEFDDKPLIKEQLRHHTERGETGVFDLDDLIEILRDERMRDICVIEIPPEKQYAQYLVLATAFSSRHLMNTSVYLNKLYKAKKHNNDPYLNSETRNGNKWHAMDMGHIVLHLMDSELREQTDLESLWTVGSKYDDQVVNIMTTIDAIKKIDETLKNEEEVPFGKMFGVLKMRGSHVRFPLERPGMFMDKPPVKEVQYSDIPHRKHQDEPLKEEVEKSFVELHNEKQPPVYEGQKIN
ncbi:unnamed protein product [Didymodactylos carnosus]|uniref:Mitochondrial assembly of ribosomal large subunit protein 1 n=1 Tax=Didymodactylos carnosus TaxID=1234261 RepID=A0A814TGX3_9BILA|nr:unnamed protein product [Didymodactylos carnosus]CAF1161229.1 unnamed protein product [Didymodactylos carnosus]CAF3582079.1 unnamed protein product [Didymodactylos carnosus]CAF3924824.1 unnamed protein product [Didymodactylos carnosus]